LCCVFLRVMRVTCATPGGPPRSPAPVDRGTGPSPQWTNWSRPMEVCMTTVRRRLAAGSLTVATLLAVGATAPSTANAAPAHDDLPTVSPAPQETRRTGHDLRLTRTVDVVVDDDTDAAARDALTAALREHGVRAAVRD